MSAKFKFEPLRKPVRWKGRYNRIPGKEPAFKVKLNGTVYAYWNSWEDDEWLTSQFERTHAVAHLGESVNMVKENHAGQGGGAFQINEFGQVLCPIAQSEDRYWVGNVEGVPRLKDPRTADGGFELKLPASTKPGTPWNRPYIGLKYNLDFNDSFFFKQTDGDTTRKLRCKETDRELVKRLREIRGHGKTLRFIVNLHGVVITRTGTGNRPVYVGRINYDKWFEKQI